MLEKVIVSLEKEAAEDKIKELREKLALYQTELLVDTGLCRGEKNGQIRRKMQIRQIRQTKRIRQIKRIRQTGRIKRLGRAGLLREKLPGKTPPSTLRTGLMRSGRQREKMPAFCCI